MADGQFSAARKLVGSRVRMRFEDGHEVVATLLSATTDTDGTQHLVYDEIQWSSDAEMYDGGRNCCYYADGRTLASVTPDGPGVTEGE